MKILHTVFSNRSLNWLIVILLFASQTGAQSTDSKSEIDVISTDTSLVTLNISVIDRKNRHIAGLKVEDFQLTDEGKPVTPAFFDSQGLQSIVFLVDVSSSMKGAKWQSLRAGLKRFLAKGREGCDYTLITFNQTPRLIVANVNAGRLWQSFEALRPDGETALYDAILLGLEALDRASQRQKALVLLSDGEDNSSQTTLPLVEQRMLARRATIYGVGILIDDRPSPNDMDRKKLLNELAQGTGGFAIYPAPERIPEVLESIRTDISGQYSLSYYPPDKGPGWRRVQVTVAPNSRDVRLRYQQRYLITSPQVANH